MNAVVALSIAGVVVAFLLKVLGGFDVPGSAYNSPGVNPQVDESFSVDAVHRATGAFSNRYMSLIDEIISYQKDPDYERAEAGRQQMMDAGTRVLGMFEDFENRLQGQFGYLIPRSETATSTGAY